MKVIGIAAISINGMIAQRPEQQSLDWASRGDTEHFKRVTKRAGVVIVGRKTYELIGKPLKERELIVLTKHPEQFENREGLLFTDKDPKDLLAELEAKRQEEVVVIGGAETYTSFLIEDLLTDFYLTIEPVFFGEGLNLVSHFDRIDAELVSVERLGEQSVLLHYTL